MANLIGGKRVATVLAAGRLVAERMANYVAPDLTAGEGLAPLVTAEMRLAEAARMKAELMADASMARREAAVDARVAREAAIIERALASHKATDEPARAVKPEFHWTAECVASRTAPRTPKQQTFGPGEKAPEGYGPDEDGLYPVVYRGDDKKTWHIMRVLQRTIISRCRIVYPDGREAVSGDPDVVIRGKAGRVNHIQRAQLIERWGRVKADQLIEELYATEPPAFGRAVAPKAKPMTDTDKLSAAEKALEAQMAAIVALRAELAAMKGGA